MHTMALRPSPSFFGLVVGKVDRLFSALGAAIAVSAAVEGHRKPKAHDLRALGIDPATFPSRYY